MGFGEVGVVEVREVLRAWPEGAGLRTVASRAGVDRKTARRYVAAAETAGLTRDAGPASLSDELVGLVLEAVRPVRPSGHTSAGRRCSRMRSSSVFGSRGGEVDGQKQDPLS